MSRIKNANFTKLAAAVVSGVMLLIGLGWFIFRRREEQAPQKTIQMVSDHDLALQGLSDQEAQGRYVEGQSNAIRPQEEHTISEIIRRNTFSIFNLSLIGLIVVQLLINRYLDALISFGVLLLNISVNTIQELIAQRRLRDVVEAARQYVTVIRDGKLNSIDPDRIVHKDLVVAGNGDQIWVDGEIVGEGIIGVDDSAITGSSDPVIKKAGDDLLAGSICLAGSAVYKVNKIGNERQIVSIIADSERESAQLTPLEELINRVLKILLALVFIYLVIFGLKFLRLDIPVSDDLINDVASVIFSMAPAGLYFMILLSYISGTADLGRLGALVPKSRSVESLAQIDVLCFTGTDILTGMKVDMESSGVPEEEGGIPDARTRQIVGDFSSSTQDTNRIFRVLKNTYEGNSRQTGEQAPYLSAAGWTGITFDDVDLKGTYILGRPALLEQYLVQDLSEPENGEGAAEEKKGVQKMLGRFGGIFSRSNEPDKDEEPTQNASPAQIEPRSEITSNEAPAEPEPAKSEKKPSLFKRTFGKVKDTLLHDTDFVEEEYSFEVDRSQKANLMFAYLPEVRELYNDAGMPDLPSDLIPLCSFRYVEKIDPESVNTINKFSDTGVDIKVFSKENPEKIIDMLKQAEIETSDHFNFDSISSSDYMTLEAEDRTDALHQNTFFCEMTPQLAARIIEDMREEKMITAVMGDSIMDLPAMQKADLSITTVNSSQSLLNNADILLMDESISILQRVLSKGQKILNGLMNILKLYLSQLFYLAILFTAIPIFSKGYPYTSAQGGMITVFTQTIPALGLTIWAAAGAMRNHDLRSTLTRFMIPAALTMAAAGTAVYIYFLEITGEMADAQMAVTFTLVAAGLMLVWFVKPPSRFWAAGGSFNPDLRIQGLTVLLLIVFVVLTEIPLAQELLKVYPMGAPQDYLVVGITVFVWVFALRFIYYFLRPTRKRE